MHFTKRLRLAQKSSSAPFIASRNYTKAQERIIVTLRCRTRYYSMRSLRIILLIGALTLLAGVLVWRWATDWGLVTLNYASAPLSKVIRSIESQGRVRISTNADPATSVTIRLKRAPVFEAIDTLAARVDGEVRLAYLGAPRVKQIAEGLAAFESGSNSGDWAVFFLGFGRGTVMSDGAVLDPRFIEWKVTPAADNSLQALLEQGAQKTGALFAVPRDWNPAPVELPSSGNTRKVVAALAKAAKGEIREVFLLTVHPPRGGEDGNAGSRPSEEVRETAQNATVFTPPRRGRDERWGNPEWMAERAQAQIAMLPRDEQAEAQRRFDEMRAFWQSLRDLPEQERRAKIEEQMNRPEVQAIMEERAAARDAKRTPQQREQRYRNYIQRKEQIKGAPTKS